MNGNGILKEFMKYVGYYVLKYVLKYVDINKITTNTVSRQKVFFIFIGNISLNSAVIIIFRLIYQTQSND